MSAEVLREAAALMRERAEAVSYPSPWSIGGGTCSVRCNDGRNYVASTYGGVGTEEVAAEHIASWHPAVALAVADWLDVVARDLRHLAGLSGCALRDTSRRPNADGPCPACAALAVARAYLGSDS